MSRLRKQGLTRRALLSRAVAAGGLAVAGAGFIAAPDAAWAVEVTAITEHQMATLLQMARDIYPHDRVGDRFYAIAIKGYDSAEHRAMVAEGIEMLDAAAREAGFDNYLAAGWEAERVAILRSIEDSVFFQTVRGGLVTGLYNQKEVWPIFGYEGESFSQGGYIDRGFDDIDWL
ncbi:Twin-arginine translocation pathway signal [Paracoccus bogoriensis]|uniref:Twin-arginine translocation pathway signal n=1 Tax=Paracoccus bogoriensis TaxID=242065 RepID=UPI001CA573F4|nr:Twin-arginine translocation pathway signal [Paracoccus bogoriensis]MBW7056728.1 Twin-arginine translocation pathway signal [Paracoccus bogoriensis]